MRIVKIAWKHPQEGTYSCGHCSSFLLVRDVTINPKHHFNPGQLYACTCGKSSFWANSVRYPKELIEYCDGKPVRGAYDPETYGFCCDEFCPRCWSVFGPLENGFISTPQKDPAILNMWNKARGSSNTRGVMVDIYGCRGGCKDNKMVVMTGEKLGELEGQKETAEWYRSHRRMWENKIVQ